MAPFQNHFNPKNGQNVDGLNDDILTFFPNLPKVRRRDFT